MAYADWVTTMRGPLQVKFAAGLSAAPHFFEPQVVVLQSEFDDHRVNNISSGEYWLMALKIASVDRAIARAKSHARKGELDQARELYQAVLEKFPKNKRAIDGLTALQPNSKDQSAPALTREQLDGVIALCTAGRLQEALSAAQDLINRNSNVPVLHNVTGAIHADLGLLDQAVESFNRALQIKPDFAAAHYNLGSALSNLGKHDEAVASYHRALEIKPDDAEVHNNLGVALKDLGENGGSVASFQKALEIKPDFAEAHYNLGNVLRDLGKHEEAVASYQRALEIEPDYADAHSNLGGALRNLGRHKEAVASYQRVLEIKPDSADGHNIIGSALKSLGKHEEAIDSYHRALQIRPDFAEAYHNLSNLKKYKPGDPEIAPMLKLAGGANAPDNELMHVNFALGKAHDDIGEFDKAFRFLVAGNQLRKSELQYDVASDRELFDLLKSIFGARMTVLPAANSSEATCQHEPIFIVGMPRSGTTLVEQILASHSNVHGAGELEILTKVIVPIISAGTSDPSQPLSIEQLKTIAETYFSGLLSKQVTERYVTDKMPLNFRWIGIILSALPGAKIVHVQRDARATCWSVFKHCFRGRGNGYAYDLHDIAEYYKMYVDLMSFWEEKFPGKIYDLSYESLTENQEVETRKLIAYCGIDWEDQCLEFHKTDRVVATASAPQVRQKMYQGSSQAWRKYEDHLQPMIQELVGYY